MHWRRRAVALLAAVSVFAACDQPEEMESADPLWVSGPALPAPVSNNAVVSVPTADGISVFSFLGMDSTKVWSGVTAAAYRWDVGSGDGWRELPPVPGPGRLAATAQALAGKVYVLGGYTVAEDGTERSVPTVDVFDPETESWSRGADIPVPTDDAVSGVWRDSLIALVSGWHDGGNVADVQWYDPVQDRWSAASPIEGTPVFGHTGAVAGDRIIYVDGAQVVEGAPRFVLDTASWRGLVGRADPGHIEWSRVVQHPGPPLYRAAGAAVGDVALFLGGSDNPYNFNGIGYDGVPSEPRHQVLALWPTGEWKSLESPPVSTMDHRQLGVGGGRVFLVGGMVAGQRVSADVWHAGAAALLASSH
jgi:hypothetical protein